MGHESKCAHLHGHNYIVHLTAKADSLDPIGRVIDFSVLKQRIGSWIETQWDHGFILNAIDTAAFAAVNEFNKAMSKQMPEWKGQRVYLLPYNPTAENLARYLLESVGPEQLQGTGVRLVKVVVEETENCSAEVKAT